MDSIMQTFLDELLAPKRRVFVSYCHRDQVEVNRFVSKWSISGGAFTHRGIGISFIKEGVNEGDNFIDSTDNNYIMRRIRSDYLEGTSVTIVMIGTCTHSRKFIDWEIKGSLTGNSPNGLIGIFLPGTPYLDNYIPERLLENSRTGYAQLHLQLPKNTDELHNWIDTAVNARDYQQLLIVNRHEIWKRNRQCYHCGVTH